jgi:hypothetical protein
MKPAYFICELVLCTALGAGQVQADQFNVDEMPEGAEVTLPRAAKTMVPLSTRITIASTDMPQTVSIVPVNASGGPQVPVTLAIFDAKQDRVKYVQVAPGSPFLYSFKGLGAITVKAKEVPGRRSASTVKLQIESDKPLTVAR